MNCPKCNHPFDEGQKFCSACGCQLPIQTELKCPVCQSSIVQNQKFCSVCGTDLHQSIDDSSIDPPKEVYQNSNLDNSNLDNKINFRCPECGKTTNSLKQAKLFNKLLFLMIYTQWQTVTYTCCPECMRRHILNRSAATLLTGNFLWPIVALPLHGYHLYKSYQPGHSKAVANAIK